MPMNPNTPVWQVIDLNKFSDFADQRKEKLIQNDDNQIKNQTRKVNRDQL